MKLKTVISSSCHINVSDREFLEFMLRPGTAGRNTLTGVLELLKRGRSTGVCEVSVLETGCIVGSIDRRPEVPRGGQNRGNKQFFKHGVASLQPPALPVLHTGSGQTLLYRKT